jgi:protein-S-isoprenylcysteine O-methyltransferase Ste14
MSDLIARLAALPGYTMGALVVLLLYTIQAEVRFGSRARAMRAGSADRRSTLLLSVASAVPVFGLALAVKASSPTHGGLLPRWFRGAVLPGLPWSAWLGVAIGAGGIALRLWAVLVLRERYTRTLLIQDEHAIERGGPYRWVRHPGYLGSLLCLNGIALASGNWITFLASLAVTAAAYGYRIRVEDEMLVAAFGDPYARYRREVGALLPARPRPSTAPGPPPST